MSSVILAACSAADTRTYERPTDWESEQCLEYCVTERIECRTLVHQELDACKFHYQQELARHEYCMRERHYGCRRPRESCSVPKFNHCSDGYDICFVGCGGKIHDADSADSDI